MNSQREDDCHRVGLVYIPAPGLANGLVSLQPRELQMEERIFPQEKQDVAAMRDNRWRTA